MEVTLSGIVTSVSALQFWNAESPMVVIPSERVTVRKALQSLKVESPMAATLPGTVIPFRSLQPWNAVSLMVVTV